MILRSQLGRVRQWLLCSFHARLAPLGDQGPVVSFCFDDFPRTAYTVGGAILKSRGVRGTYYAAMGLANTVNHMGDQFGLDDLNSLLADGHELGSHTFSHISCRTVPFRVYERDLLKGRDAIRDATGCHPSNFAYPRGHVTLTAKPRVGAQMRSCRGIYGGLNGPMVDLNLLRANRVYGDVDQFDKLASLLSENEKRKAWLIFYTHDVSPHPSQFGCTPSLFERIVARSLERGSRVVPVGEVLDGVQAPSLEVPQSGSPV